MMKNQNSETWELCIWEHIVDPTNYKAEEKKKDT